MKTSSAMRCELRSNLSPLLLVFTRAMISIKEVFVLSTLLLSDCSLSHVE